MIEAELTFARHGRIYALTGSESPEAESMRQRQQQQAGGAVRHDTYFTNPPSQIASNAVRLCTRRSESATRAVDRQDVDREPQRRVT